MSRPRTSRSLPTERPKTSSSSTKLKPIKLVHNYSKIVAGATFLLIVAGGLVTSTGSGLSVPDWPLSYGQAFPPMVGGIRFEHTHRLIAGLVGLLTLFLTIVIFKKEKRRWMKGLGLAAMLAVIAQALLGGLTVIYLLPVAVSVFHACLAQTFFALVGSLVYFTSREWTEAPSTVSENARSIQRLLIATSCFIYAQLILGSVVRHTTGRGINFHMILAVLIAMHILFILARVARSPEIRGKLLGHTLISSGLIFLQIVLGLGAYFFVFMTEKSDAPTTGRVLVTTTHQAGGALVLVTIVVLTLRALRLFKSTG